MDIVTHGPVRYGFSDRWGGAGTGRYGELNLGDHVGDDPDLVARNRRIAAGSLGAAPDRVHYMTQVHGTGVEVVDGPWPDLRQPEADALVTDRPGEVLAVMVADCVPVLLADPEARVVGAAHAGRQGMARGVVPAAIEAMVRLGADPARMIAFTGPAACGSCYEVPEDMRAEVAALVPEAWAVTAAGTAGVDVPAAVWAQLRAAGITRGVRSPVCTIESPEHYSYRREGVTGRFAGFVSIEPGR
ncbi:MAG TPA: peptidoglycan editing factor PgeF [Actinocrinis sp.]|nr:peptidoglycan editing factor PgeF [Actinocrinis sp.]